MTFPQGVDFRQTAAFVTDPTNFTHDLGTTVYPTASPQGNNIGWVATTGLSARNRSATVDARLAGIVFRSSATSTYKIDLPAAGTYNIALAIGDDTSIQQGQGCQIFDGATWLATPVTFPTTSAAGSFYDATGTEYTAANWPGSNTKVQLTFAGTTASFVFGGTSNTWTIASIYIEAASVGTTITSNSATPFESFAQLDQNSFGLVEAGTNLQRDSAPQAEWGMALTTNSSTPLESLNSFIMNSDNQIEFLLRVNNNSQVFQELLATQIVRNSVDTESLTANFLNIDVPIEIKSSLIQIVSNESAPLEATSNFSINTIFPIEVISTNKLILSNTTAAVELLGSVTENTSHQDDWLSSQVSQFSGTGEWLLAVKLNNSILEAWQSALLHNSIIQVEFVGSLVSDTSAPLEYVGTTKLIVGNSILPVEFTISVSGDQRVFDELIPILSHIITVEDEFAGTPINILLSSIGRLARSVKIRLSESTTKVRLLGPKTRSPR